LRGTNGTGQIGEHRTNFGIRGKKSARASWASWTGDNREGGVTPGSERFGQCTGQGENRAGRAGSRTGFVPPLMA